MKCDEVKATETLVEQQVLEIESSVFHSTTTIEEWRAFSYGWSSAQYIGSHRAIH